jgi:hypothetical protein
MGKDPVYLVGQGVTWFSPGECAIGLVCRRYFMLAEWVAGFESAKVRLPDKAWSSVPGPACMYCLVQVAATAWGIRLDPEWFEHETPEYEELLDWVVFKGLLCRHCRSALRASGVNYIWGVQGLTQLRCKQCGSTVWTQQGRARYVPA